MGYPPPPTPLAIARHYVRSKVKQHKLAVSRAIGHRGSMVNAGGRAAV
jgi:hypothetical protein